MAEQQVTIHISNDEALSSRRYYAGISIYRSLLDTTAKDPRVTEGFVFWGYSRKRISCVHSHAIIDLWDELARIIEPLNTKGAWLVLSCYRIGNENNNEAENPVVALLHIVKTLILAPLLDIASPAHLAQL
jgi:hypothetical protein